MLHCRSRSIRCTVSCTHITYRLPWRISPKFLMGMSNIWKTTPPELLSFVFNLILVFIPLSHSRTGNSNYIFYTIYSGPIDKSATRSFILWYICVRVKSPVGENRFVSKTRTARRHTIFIPPVGGESRSFFRII